MSQGANENLKWKQENFMKRGEMRLFKSLLALVHNMIGWESGASFPGQSAREVKQKQSNPKTPFGTQKNCPIDLLRLLMLELLTNRDQPKDEF